MHDESGMHDLVMHASDSESDSYPPASGTGRSTTLATPPVRGVPSPSGVASVVLRLGMAWSEPDSESP